MTSVPGNQPPSHNRRRVSVRSVLLRLRTAALCVPAIRRRTGSVRMDDAPQTPPLMSSYADRHGVFHLMQDMVSSLLMDQPDDPLSHLIHFLSRSRLDVPRILVVGPPSVGKQTVASRLSAELGAVHVTTDSLLTDQSELSAQLPVEQRVRQRLRDVDCFHRGWVLEGFPQTRLQALNLQQLGVVPEHVVILDAPDDVLSERRDGKLTDPQTGNVYHQTFVRQLDDIIARRLVKGRGLTEERHRAELQRFRCEVTGLSSAYHSVRRVHTNQSHEDVHRQVLSFVGPGLLRTRSSRILVLGPPGSGRRHQAALLAGKYKMVDVSCEQLIRSAAVEGSSLGEKIRFSLDRGGAVPVDLALQVVLRSLRGPACSRRGWILHGFPEDLQGARALQENGFQPSRVYFLEVTDDVCLERLSLRGTDPVTGERFHAVTRPAPSAEIQNRLRTRPQDRTQAVTQALNQYRSQAAALQAFYPDAVLVDADQDPLSVFESLECRLKSL